VRKIKTFIVGPDTEEEVNTFLKDLAERNIVDADIDLQTVPSSAPGQAVVVIAYRVPSENQTQQWAGFAPPS
jgi:hypothetical protein